MKKYFSYACNSHCFIFCRFSDENEWHLHQSKSIFIKLKPVDPRSIFTRGLYGVGL